MNQTIRILVIPLLVLLLLLSQAGCSERVEPLPPLAHDAVILAFGDSLTYGTGASAEDSYPAVLSRLTGREVINAGVPGEVSRDGLRRLPDLLDRHRPHLLLLAHGGNDMLRRQDLEQMERNLEEMVLLARERGIPVVLLGVPRPSIMGLSSADAYYNVAKATGTPLEDSVIPQVIANSELRSDRVHPNATGYRKMGEAVYELLQHSGAL